MGDTVVFKQCASCRTTNRIRVEIGLTCRCGKCGSPIALTHYEVLGITSAASANEIKAAYRRAAKTWHPDVHPDRAFAERQFRKIAQAFSILSDPIMREQYDLSLAASAGDANCTSNKGNKTKDAKAKGTAKKPKEYRQTRAQGQRQADDRGKPEGPIWRRYSFGGRQMPSQAQRSWLGYAFAGVGAFTTLTISGAIFTGLFGSKLALVVLLGLAMVGALQLLYLLTKLGVDSEA
ncbi:DnaJ-like protein [Alicyclobacillus sacchari]|uniref:DnaJ-like protein n=1 Tax=Alicyclobacillus sacchari TaxID=392010 RepID=A0A4R8LGX5_9BACL|nr:J domain-containing protein [Alicyclobacillus sacchari]TDY42418.1 DnaJ-like protein [Alicyclobacillus sacchari]